MPFHHSGHVSAIKSPAIKLKSSAVDQRGCQIYVWLSFCQAQAGNIWTEMLSVMWQSFTTGCTLSAQDKSGSEIWSRWRTPEYFTVDLVFNFQPSSLKSVQSTKKIPFHEPPQNFVEKTRWGEIVTEWQIPRAVNVYSVLSWPSEEVLSFLHNFLWSDHKWTSFSTIPTLLNLRRPLLWNVFNAELLGTYCDVHTLTWEVTLNQQTRIWRFLVCSYKTQGEAEFLFKSLWGDNAFVFITSYAIAIHLQSFITII